MSRSITEKRRNGQKKRHVSDSARISRRKKIFAVLLIVATVILARFITDAYLDNKALEYLKTNEVPTWITQNFIDEDARSGAALDEINAIVVHYVANPGSSAQANRNYFNKKSTEVSSHFIVGLEGEIIQCVPLSEQSVASNSRNRDTISIEVCHPDETGEFSALTMSSLVKLTAWLRETCRLGRSDVIRHYDITGKMCPKYYVEHEGAWKNFQNQV